MITSETFIRVRYGETDSMGFVYYGRYAEYFEVARVEMLRELGFSYRKLEDEGILLPVLTYNIRYIKPAYYDDVLRIKTTIRELPSARITFSYETFSAEEILINQASTTLVFIRKSTNRPCAIPPDLLEVMKDRF